MRDVLLCSSLPSARYRSPNSAPSSRTRIERRSVSRETLVCVSSVDSAPRGPLAACLVSRRPPRPSTPSLLHRTAPDTPASPHRVMAPTPDSRHAPPSRHHRAARRRAASPLAAAAASVALTAAEPVAPAAPAAALPRGPALARPPRLVPHASAPPARALRARRPRRRRGPPRATSRRPYCGPPPDAHASPPSPHPTLAPPAPCPTCPRPHAVSCSRIAPIRKAACPSSTTCIWIQLASVSRETLVCLASASHAKCPLRAATALRAPRAPRAPPSVT